MSLNFSMLSFVRDAQSMRFRRLLPGLLALSVGASSLVSAHDFWVEPETFRAAIGAKVALNLHVGQDFKGDSVIFSDEYFNRYVVGSAAGEKKVDGTLGDEPAGTITIARPGLHTVLYDSKKFDVAFDDFNKFRDYLKDEGLDRQLILAQAKYGKGGKILEIYSRCAKALIAGPQADAEAPDRNFNCALELIPETNPYRLSGSGEVKLRLLYKNAPVEGVLVVAFNKADPLTKLKLRTDKDGRIAFNLPRPGVWLVKAVHMVVPARLIRGDWESFWASLTFEVPVGR